MSLIPLDDRVFVEVVEEIGSRGGVFVAWIDKGPKKPDFNRQFRGKVIAVGPGLPHKNGRYEPLLEVGNEVIFKGWHWLDVEVDGKKLKQMRERDIDLKLIKDDAK
jgi:co-chaperonin GroES (HSP10)